MKIKVPIELLNKHKDREKGSGIEWELPEGFDCDWYPAPPPIVLVLREEHEDGSYRDLQLAEVNKKEY
jgi:hypothetical protein